jgi:BlaI family penicillinase repressor
MLFKETHPQPLGRILTRRVLLTKKTKFLRRLCDRGIIENNDTIVHALVEREQVLRAESGEHIDKFYNSSLKLFFTTFLKKEKLTADEICELKRIIEECEAEE